MSKMKKIFLLSVLFPIIIFGQLKEEFRGVKLTNVDSQILFTNQNTAEAMDYLASIGINTVLTVVTSRGYTCYPSSVMQSIFNQPILSDFTGRDPLERVIIEAHRNGIEVLPWFEYGFASSYGQNGGHIIQKFPQWGLKNNSNQFVVKNGFYWMSGINPEVQNFILSLVTEVLDNYDIDGIEFSDRMPAMPVEGGYDSVTVALYKEDNNGTAPPQDFRNNAWMRWRADKLNDFYRAVRDSIKIRGEHLFNDSSPSVYPWCYSEYLQDSKTWINEGIVDNIIPQFYRYNISDYIFEVNQSLTHVIPSKRDKIVSGMLIKLGSYVISPEFFLASMEAHRSRGITGEAFFFYEGLRANNNRIGDTLRATYYSEPALVPGRNGNIWRPKAEITNEDDENAFVEGSWQTLNFPGFKPNIIMAKDTGYASITYNFDVPFDAWFGVYAYIVPNSLNTTEAPYTIYSSDDSTVVLFDQRNPQKNGWQKIGDVYLTKGNQKVLRLDNSNIGVNRNIIADAAMIMINRKLSPDVIVTSVNEDKIEENIIPEEFMLNQNFPNPFNPSTTISFQLPVGSNVTLKIYDVLGREVASLIKNEWKDAGNYNYQLSIENFQLTSGVYFYQLQANEISSVKKMMLLK